PEVRGRVTIPSGIGARSMAGSPMIDNAAIAMRASRDQHHGPQLGEIAMRLATTLLCAALAVPAGRASAQDDYPNRPIRVIVPVGAGAGIDTAARVVTAAVEPHL